MRARYSVIVATLLLLTAKADAQTKTPNGTAPGAIRMWPSGGSWATFLVRTDDLSLGCSMASGRVEDHKPVYFAGFSQKPGSGLTLVINDVEKSAVEGTKIRLLFDDVPVGDFVITSHKDIGNGLHGIYAVVSANETRRITDLLSTAGTVKFVTDNATFAFPLIGAAQAVINMKNCISEAVNLKQE